MSRRKGGLVVRGGRLHARVTWMENGKRRGKWRAAKDAEHARELIAEMLKTLPPERPIGALSEPIARPGYVYFIQMLDGGIEPIKIGIAENVQQRMAQLLTSSPYELIILGSIEARLPHMLETIIQGHCRHLHMRGEWFRPGPELFNYIADPSVANLRRIRAAA